MVTTTANDFFNNSAGVERAKLVRNIFGGSVGGPIKKDRTFYLANYEARRDASEGSAVCKVPNHSMRNGFLRYRGVSGAVQELDPAFIRSNIDPLKVGSSPAALEYFRSFPTPNDSTVGDGLNTAGYRFTAPTPLVWNTLISKIDWTADRNGAHHMFVRGNYQDDSIGGIPQFPGQSPNRETKDTSRELAFGYTGLLGSSIVSTFRYGFTDQKVDLTGVQTGALAGHAAAMPTGPWRSVDRCRRAAGRQLRFDVKIRSQVGERSPGPLVWGCLTGMGESSPTTLYSWIAEDTWATRREDGFRELALPTEPDGPMGRLRTAFRVAAMQFAEGLSENPFATVEEGRVGYPYRFIALSIFLLVKSILHICTGPVAFSRSLNVATVLVPVSSNPRYVTA